MSQNEEASASECGRCKVKVKCNDSQVQCKREESHVGGRRVKVKGAGG